MSQSNPELAQIVVYMKAHWPSHVKPEWQVKLEEYPAILKKVIADFTLSATKNYKIIRITGPSGSGKTTQILPAAEAYCGEHHINPILIAARRFVEYHPHYNEIKSHYGEENIRKLTDEFSTIMLFLTISELIQNGYDIILDVSLLDPAIEAILLKLIQTNHYEPLILMIAASPTVTEYFLQNRAWRHTKATEQEFTRATSLALNFYADHAPDFRIVIWSVYDLDPVYDGPVSDCLGIFNDYSTREDLPKSDDDARRAAKITYLTQSQS